MTTNYPIQRPPSEQLVDLHVYLLPREVWNEKNSSAYNESFSEAVSAGFVRVSRNQTVSDLRLVIEEQLGPDTLPPNYVFLRSVGRRMTQVKPKQELELKCKAFLPPEAWAPEIVVLEPQKDSRGFQTYQSYPGYSPRHDTTQPISGIPTHFPQIANHDRMAPPTDAGLGEGLKIVLETSQEKAQNKSSPDKRKIAKSKDRNLAKEGEPTAKKGNARPVIWNKEMANTKAPQTEAVLERIKRLRKAQASWSKEARQAKISKAQEQKKKSLGTIRDRNVRVRKVETGLENEKNLPRGKGQMDGLKNTCSGRKIGRKIEQDSVGTTPRLKGRVVEVPPVKAHRLGRLLHDRTAQMSGIYIGHSPMVQQQQQQQGYKGDPLHNMVGTPGKSGRPDAYTNNTNEDSGIAEPTPDDEDPAYERRKSDIDDQYYNQLEPSQTDDEPLQHGERRWDQSDRYQEKEIEDERQRQAEIQQREEEKRKEEERRNAERQKEEERRKAERQREEERREHKRKLEQKRQEDAKEQRQREKQKKLEEERRKEEEKRKEEMARKEEEERLLEEEQQQSITDRAGVADFDGAVPLDEGDDDYDDAAMTMETNQALDNHGYFVNDEQMRRRAEDELRDYQPQSTWKMDEEGDRETGHLAHPSSRIRSREDTEMELASQQAVQDGLKRVHLTPELHRKAKIGKIRDNSVTDEEDVYETDPEMAGLLEQLQIARQERMKKEKERENVIKRARDLQTKTYERRNRSRDYWKKRYYDEKKKTAPLEDQGNRIRNQLEVMHRKLLSHIEGKKKGVSVKGPPSKKNDHKINILKMQHELDELRRKVDNSRMKLTSEIKLRNQAEEEVRGLKSEVTQRKINMTLIRNQKLAALKTGENKLLSKTPIPALGQGPMSMSAKR